MSFKSKLITVFTIVLTLPIILSIIAFYVIGNVLARSGGSAGLKGFTNLSSDIYSYDAALNGIYDEICKDYERGSGIAGDGSEVSWPLENEEYLEEKSKKLRMENSYIVVRKDSEIYYTGDPADSDRIVPLLPAYDSEQDEDGSSFYLDRVHCMVKQKDFIFRDGSQGSFFIVTHIVAVVSGKTVTIMMIAMLAILAITAILLIRWLRDDFFRPIQQLNEAMNRIRDGNFNYVLTTGEKGEIGELYRNYEDMRLRLKETADEKLEGEKRDRELISNISHDLKTPLTSIKGYVEGLMDGIANTPEKQEKYIRTIYNKANDMDRLINELTLYSKIDNNKIPYNFRKINISDYFGDCVEEIGMDLESRGIELNYSNLLSRDTLVIADPEQLRRVVNNIISNSVKYMDKQRGKIDIRILDEQDSVRIEIEDNGKGIAARDLPKIFDRFFRTDSSRNSAQGGSGIGLSIVKKIIEDHGGYIWATSKEGMGTCMHFVLRKYWDKESDSVEVETPERKNK